MKGLWSGEKNVSSTYRPAVDALRAINSELLRNAFAVVCSTGAALMVATTRDHGAVCLTLLDGSDRRKVYCSDVQELHQALADLIESFEPATPPTQPSGEAKPRK